MHWRSQRMDTGMISLLALSTSISGFAIYGFIETIRAIF